MKEKKYTLEAWGIAYGAIMEQLEWAKKRVKNEDGFYDEETIAEDKIVIECYEKVLKKIVELA